MTLQLVLNLCLCKLFGDERDCIIGQIQILETKIKGYK